MTEKEEEIRDKTDEVKKYKSLDVIAKSEGGEILIDDLKQKIADNVNTLDNSFLTISESQLRALCANLSALLGVLRLLTQAEKNAKVKAEDLENLLEENKEE